MIQKDDNSRTYKIGNNLVTLQKKALDKLIKWTVPPYNASAFLDQRFVRILFLVLVGSDEIKKPEKPGHLEAATDFIRDLYLIRVKGNRQRAMKFETYREKFIQDVFSDELINLNYV